MTNLRNRKTCRLGAIAPLVAVMLLVLLVAGGIAVEYTRLRLVSTELQAAADNVARSSANELLLSDSTESARQKGREIASKYKVGNATFSIQDSDIDFGRFNNNVFVENASPPNAIRVNSSRSASSSAGPMGMIFGAMFGVNTANISRSATASFRLVDICFVLDRSSSMKLEVESNAGGLSLSDPRAAEPPRSNSRWRALDIAFDAFIDELEGNNADERVAIVSFASDFTAFGVTTPATRIDLDLHSNLALAKSQMNSISNSLWNGNTYIEAGMRDGFTVLTTSPNRRQNAEKIMIVLTDGFQNIGDASSAAVDAASSDITIHSIAFGDFADQVLMQDIAGIGNGQYAHASDSAALMQIMKDLAASLTTLVD